MVRAAVVMEVALEASGEEMVGAMVVVGMAVEVTVEARVVAVMVG